MSRDHRIDQSETSIQSLLNTNGASFLMTSPVRSTLWTLNNLRKFRLIYEQLLNNNMSFYGFNDEILCRSHKQYPVRLQWNYVLVCKAGPPITWRSIIKGQGLPWLKEILKLPFSSIYLIWFKRTSEEILTAGNPKFWYIFFFRKTKIAFSNMYAHHFHELSSLETRRNFLCVYFYQK